MKIESAEVKKIIVIFLIWLFVVNVFAVLALNRFNLRGDSAYFWIDSSNYYQTKEWGFDLLHAQWDSFWILDVAEKGYYLRGENEISNVVFFPMYPFLIKAISLFFGGNSIFAGWLISVIFLFLALLYLYKLVKEFHPQLDPFLPLIFLLVFPTAFFLNTVYTESVFLFLSVASIYYARKKNYWLSGALGMFAALTRITGLLVFIPVFWEALKDADFKISRLFNPLKILVFLIPLGTLSFFLFHQIKFGEFLLFFRIENLWGRSFRLNVDHFISVDHAAIVNLGLDVFFVVFALMATFFVFKKIRFSYGLYMLATLLVALSTGTFMSIGRYVLILFPLYILGASIRDFYWKQLWLFISTILFALYTILFVNHYWAG